jgi:ABC transport system ATP-binding/permease protein
MFKLVIEDDAGNKTVVPIIRDEISIGRNDGNTIRLTERNVSRKHARLLRVDGQLFVENISARYGTKKNGAKMNGRTPFKQGDLFVVGDYRLTLEPETPAQPPAQPPTVPDDELDAFGDEPTMISHRDTGDRRQRLGTAVLPSLPGKLVVVSSNFAGKEFSLDLNESVIGRSREADIRIDHRSVSQNHAKIVRGQNSYEIVDLKSKNGVKINNVDYRRVALSRGDIIELGYVRFRYVEAGENYVYLPQEHIGPSTNESVSKKWILAAVALLALVGLLGLFLTENEEIASPTAVTPIPSEIRSDRQRTKVETMLKRASEEIKSGEMAKAIASLEMTRDLADPTPAQLGKIDDLLTTARSENAAALAFEDGKALMRQSKPLAALETFEKIPPEPTSIIYNLLVESKSREEAISDLVKGIETDIAASNLDDAREAVDELRLYENDLPRLVDLDTRIEARANELREPRPETEEPPVKARSKKAARKTKKRKTARRKKPRPSPKSAFKKDPALGKKAYEKAGKALIGGRHQEAINSCRTGLKHGIKKCYNVLGVAYQKTDQIKKACYNFRKAGSTDRLKKLNCSP